MEGPDASKALLQATALRALVLRSLGLVSAFPLNTLINMADESECWQKVEQCPVNLSQA